MSTNLRLAACMGKGRRLHPLLLLLAKEGREREIASPFDVGAQRVAFEADSWECLDSAFPELVVVLYGRWDRELLPREHRVPDALPFSFPVKNLTPEERDFFAKNRRGQHWEARLAFRN